MNIEITTQPTGRSPENKFFFGEKKMLGSTQDPKYNKIGLQADYPRFFEQMFQMTNYKHNLFFETVGITFRVMTNDDRHAQFVRNMFTVEDETTGNADWQIFHNTELMLADPKIYVHLDKREMLIAGTTFLGEIKKGVFGIISFVLPKQDILPMHCSAFTYNPWAKDHGDITRPMSRLRVEKRLHRRILTMNLK